MVAMGAISSIYVGHSCPSNGCCVPAASERAKRALRLLSATTERVLFVAHICTLLAFFPPLFSLFLFGFSAPF
ncbi:unnamed protein product [Sphagnum jensenii]|uniref:Uncharacterized protein n=1 Tax=Sphagnum jensenii TaxID=128206 RepID=A0ABP1BMF0_9BRYO